MTALTLDGHHGRPVAIDICHACQAFWFDGYESLQLAPASVLKLFREIGDRATEHVTALSEVSACPRCKLRLMPAHDQQRSTKFEYRRCPQRHGRLISFFNFLREKDFIRPLSGEQLEALRRNVQTVNCSNCGAPVNLATGTACGHCGSPLSMVDMHQAEALIAKLKETANAASQGVDPALPLALSRARLEVSTAFAAFNEEPGWFVHASSAGLVSAAISSIAKWLR